MPDAAARTGCSIVADYYLVVNDHRYELSETDIGLIADRLPGTAFASEMMADSSDREEIEIDVGKLGIDREKLREAVAEVRLERASSIWGGTLAAIEAELAL